MKTVMSKETKINLLALSLMKELLLVKMLCLLLVQSTSMLVAQSINQDIYG
jgi:hypothetical protein